MGAVPLDRTAVEKSTKRQDGAGLYIFDWVPQGC
jgi:hypothetical protein